MDNNLSKKQEVHIVVIVWGNEYLDFFLKINLPNQMSEENLIFLSNQKKFKIIFKIYTTEKDKKIIECSDIYKKIIKYIQIEIILIILEDKFKYIIMNKCHENSLREAFKKDSILIFLSPDLICSNNLYFSLFSYIDQGFRCVAAVGIRLAKQNFLEYINEKSIDLKIPPRKLVEISLKNLHVASKSLFFDSKTIPSGYQSQLYFRIDDNNLYVRAFHLHPIMIWPEKEIKVHSPIDSTLIEETLPSKEKIKIIEDSDDFVLFELTDMNYENVYGDLIERKISHIAKWCERYTTDFNKFFIKHKMLYRSTEINPLFGKIKRKSDRYIRKIYIIYKFNKFKKKIYNNLEKIKKLFFLNKIIKKT